MIFLKFFSYFTTLFFYIFSSYLFCVIICWNRGKKNDYYKIISNVTAEVVITSELYGDYSGKLATIESGDEEWSLFVGVVAPSTGAMSKEQAAMVK